MGRPFGKLAPGGRRPANSAASDRRRQGAGRQKRSAPGRTQSRRAREAKYDLIVLDMQMPVMDGLEAARQLRQSPELEQVPIVAMTANACAEDRRRCLAAGMDDFLTKPVLPGQLHATVLFWLAGK